MDFRIEETTPAEKIRQLKETAEANKETFFEFDGPSVVVKASRRPERKIYFIQKTCFTLPIPDRLSGLGKFLNNDNNIPIGKLKTLRRRAAFEVPHASGRSFSVSIDGITPVEGRPPSRVSLGGQLVYSRVYFIF